MLIYGKVQEQRQPNRKEKNVPTAASTFARMLKTFSRTALREARAVFSSVRAFSCARSSSTVSRRSSCRSRCLALKRACALRFLVACATMSALQRTVSQLSTGSGPAWSVCRHPHLWACQPLLCNRPVQEPPGHSVLLAPERGKERCIAGMQPAGCCSPGALLLAGLF